MAWFNNEIINRVEQEPTKLNSYFQNGIILIPASLLFSFINILLFKLFSATFSQYYFITQFKNQVEILNETLALDNENQRDMNVARRLLIKELTGVFILGLVAGFYYSIIYFMLYLILYFFLVFLLINITTFTVSVTISMLAAWLIISIYLISTKLKVEEIQTRYLNPLVDYGLTERSVEILKSNLPPVICQGCRSYISASSTTCPVCGDPVEDNLT